MAAATSATRQVALNASTATSLCGLNNDTNAGVPRTLWINCSADIYIGFSGAITAGTGAKLPANIPFSIALNAGQQLYAIAASATPTVHVVDKVG